MDARAIEELGKLIGDPARVSTAEDDLTACARDESLHRPHRPDAVVWAKSAAEVSAVLRWANRNGVPVTPRGGGSSLEGNPIPVRGGIVLALERMDEVVALHEADLQICVQPGVIYDALNEALAPHKLFFPPAPGSSDVATVGGMVANNSSGMHALKYGVTGDYVLALEVVLPSGEIIRTGTRARKSVSGYDLVSLFVGSEGTLGVITEITLKLFSLPEQISAVAVFPTPQEAAQAIYRVNRYAPTPAALEWMDANMISLVNRWTGTTLREGPTLVMEFHGIPAGIQAEAEIVRGLCEACGCVDFQVGYAPEEQERLWAARRGAHDAIKYLHPGYVVIIGDIVVPISHYPQAVERAYAAGRAHDVTVYTFGHAGDGNLHFEVLVREDDPASWRRGKAVNAAVVNYAISVGGTATGEHGVGIGKRDFMAVEHGASLPVMRALKQLLDPQGILNPGKILPDEK